MKMNKKGFTLAELLIVIAIIAILIAIAIPAFSASLYSAKLQTDHANIRNAYAVFQTARLTDVLDDGTATGVKASAATGKYVFQKDGSLTTANASPYLLQVTASDPTTDCASSIGCNVNAVNGVKAASHTKGNQIVIEYDGTTAKAWQFSVEAP